LWMNDMRHGQGTMIYQNGNKFVGLWINDMRHGEGICYYLMDGNVQQGRWEYDKFAGTLTGKHQ
jgi:hypothetical protein